MYLGVIPKIIEMALYRTLLHYTLPYRHAYQYVSCVRIVSKMHVPRIKIITKNLRASRLCQNEYSRTAYMMSR